MTPPYKYILTPSVMCSEQLHQIFVLQSSTMSLLFKIYCSQKLHICWLDSLRPDSSHETQRILIDMVQISETQTTTHSVKDKIGKSWLAWKYVIRHPLFYLPLPFYRKNLNLLFLGKFGKLKASFLRRREKGGGPTMPATLVTPLFQFFSHQTPLNSALPCFLRWSSWERQKLATTMMQMSKALTQKHTYRHIQTWWH